MSKTDVPEENEHDRLVLAEQARLLGMTSEFIATLARPMYVFRMADAKLVDGFQERYPAGHLAAARTTALKAAREIEEATIRYYDARARLGFTGTDS